MGIKNLKKNNIIRIFIFITTTIVVSTILITPNITPVPVPNSDFALNIGDVLTFQTEMTNTANWTLKTLYHDRYVSVDLLKEDSEFFAEVTDYFELIVYVRFNLKSKITEHFRVDKLLVYSSLHFVENGTINEDIPDVTVNVIWKENEVIVTTTEPNITSIGIYERSNYKLINYTSIDIFGRSFL